MIASHTYFVKEEEVVRTRISLIRSDAEQRIMYSTLTARGHIKYRQPSLYAISLSAFSLLRDLGEKKTLRKLYSNFAVTVYGGGVPVWRAHQLVTSYQYQCEREC
jgi:hypothetical protein